MSTTRSKVKENNWFIQARDEDVGFWNTIHLEALVLLSRLTRIC